ncbi:enolase C-terminal domain-like protein [Haladaptatus sp. GCM10025707]|uniref:enolase C-terminal domain-like protein n=1 Tax=unclassified Haladaptatus TaxID=2622732 RepID=UPI0023E8837C|nr:MULTISPECIES: enolase C-terminal domain-like protein [unclassified Haladaptatus]
MPPAITRIETVEFTYPIANATTNPRGFDLAYAEGATHDRTTYALRIETDAGIAGEYVGGNPPAFAQVNMVADYLVGKNPLAREKHWSELKRALRKYDRMGIGPLDIALWDFAGKYHDAPIHELLGTYRTRLPAYASTYFGTEGGGLESPTEYADFAEACLDRGFGAFKIHPVGGIDDRDFDQEIETVRTVGERVGDEMDLMLDPVCEYETFGDALKVGKACDEAGYFWYEDPYRDGSTSQHGHRKLREALDTPLLITEMLRGLESHTDFVANEATDFVRADPEWDGGITGAMKIARVAEGFGLDVEYHLSGPAQRHCMAATRNSNFYELGLVGPEATIPHAEGPFYAGGYTDSMDAADDGTYTVPEGPGLGVTYDWEYIRENALGGRVYE